MSFLHPVCRPANATKVLFLQGPPSDFARRLGAELRARGAEVWRINLCLGDWLFWRGAGSCSYRGSLAAWPAWLERFCRARGITDILYFGDRIPYHVAAREVGERLGLNVTSYEYGYLRPDWIVAEPGGQGAYSRLTSDPRRLRAAAWGLPRPDLARCFAFPPEAEARGDVLYHLSNYLCWMLYPGYRRDRRHNPVVEYLSYLPRHRRARRGVGEARALARRLRIGGTPFFLVALQMQGDYQIRANSPYRDQRAFLAEVLASFARAAPSGAELVVKLHPHDNGLVPWRRFLARRARALGLAGRVQVLDGGALEDWALRARGLVTVNSTAGLMALARRCPVRVAGVAVYDMPGLTHQGGLDGFWRAPAPPDPELLADVLRVFAAHLHVRGDFYGTEGMRKAVTALADRLLEHGAPPDIFDDAPPRLARARAIGVPVHGCERGDRPGYMQGAAQAPMPEAVDV
ncbi:MAG: capsular biosynthesis protein [Rhodobacteraceae bacterium]|nr:capsular biosynthesis protein [Paracoccaceae bacterium]MBR9819601.1 capsular biosynthesis protein [Paracoccaceae bacterium]